MTYKTLTLSRDGSIEVKEHPSLRAAEAYAREEIKWENTDYSRVTINGVVHETLEGEFA